MTGAIHVPAFSRAPLLVGRVMHAQAADGIVELQRESPRINLGVAVCTGGDMTVLGQLFANGDGTARVRFNWRHIRWRRRRRRAQ